MCISHCGNRMLYGKVVPRHPSRFLEHIEDLSPDVLRKHSSTRGNSWTQNHRSTPRGVGSWSQPLLSTNATKHNQSNTPSALLSAEGAKRLTPSDVPPGTRVTHKAFGPGEVRDLSGLQATVIFKDKVRVLSLEHAPLELA